MWEVKKILALKKILKDHKHVFKKQEEVEI